MNTLGTKNRLAVTHGFATKKAQFDSALIYFVHMRPSPNMCAGLTVPHCPSLPAGSALLTGQHGNPRVSCGKSKNPGIHEGEI